MYGDKPTILNTILLNFSWKFRLIHIKRVLLYVHVLFRIKLNTTAKTTLSNNGQHCQMVTERRHEYIQHWNAQNEKIWSFIMKNIYKLSLVKQWVFYCKKHKLHFLSWYIQNATICNQTVNGTCQQSRQHNYITFNRTANWISQNPQQNWSNRSYKYHQVTTFHSAIQ